VADLYKTLKTVESLSRWQTRLWLDANYLNRICLLGLSVWGVDGSSDGFFIEPPQNTFCGDLNAKIFAIRRFKILRGFTDAFHLIGFRIKFPRLWNFLVEHGRILSCCSPFIGLFQTLANRLSTGQGKPVACALSAIPNPC
jgi:hypothetical protein